MPKPVSIDNEVIALPENDGPQRRKFSAGEKLRILREADACTERGDVGKLLRKEGIYASQLASWRLRLEAEGAKGLKGKKVGRKPIRDAKDRRISELEKRNAKLEDKLRISEALLELSGKAHEILGIALPRIEEAQDSSLSSSNSARRRSR
ncbi:MAG: hypothetical protein KA712_22640 [Myxococcales bacterium]|nr:hypothetical protein [Myxococcales bacterium]MCG5051811.1 hypothetical protein [Myxococcales bacterium]MCG5054671.1 hypothetical protein [Myxococcales bacterium]MCG5055765.1 hypothetical protein [Myxococcales bacterium]